MYNSIRSQPVLNCCAACQRWWSWKHTRVSLQTNWTNSCELFSEHIEGIMADVKRYGTTETEYKSKFAWCLSCAERTWWLALKKKDLQIGTSETRTDTSVRVIITKRPLSWVSKDLKSWQSTSVKYRLVFMCSKNRSWDVLLVPCPPRHPCDARGANHLIVVYVSSRTSVDLISTGSHSCSSLSACCEYTKSRTHFAVPATTQDMSIFFGIWHHCRVYSSRRGLCLHDETRNLQRAFISHVAVANWSWGTPASIFVLDVVNQVLEIRRTSCTMDDSGKVSDSADPTRIDQECLDLRVLQDELASVPPHGPTFAGQSASVTLERHRHSHQLSPRAPSASLWQRTKSLPCATVFGCVGSGSCQERRAYLSRRKDHSRTSHAWKSARIVRPSGRLNITNRPPSCWTRAPIAVWIPGSGNCTLCPGYLSNMHDAVHHCLEAKTLHQLVFMWKTRNRLPLPLSDLPVQFLNWTSKLRSCSVSVKDTTVGAVSEDWFVSTTSTYVPLPQHLLLFV